MVSMHVLLNKLHNHKEEEGGGHLLWIDYVLIRLLCRMYEAVWLELWPEAMVRMYNKYGARVVSYGAVCETYVKTKDTDM